MKKTVKKLFLGKSSFGKQAECNPIQKEFKTLHPFGIMSIKMIVE